MEKVALYRRYRPYNFKNLVGQDNIKNALINAIKASNPSHAYLFCGPRGTGKTTTARLVAKALNCENLTESYEPCNQCQFCNQINDGSFIDLIEIDAASNRGIDEIRDLKEKINFAPSRAKVKVYIIDEVHMLTKEAFNALLKTLEEPPSCVYFILATTEVHKIPETIVSRCQRFDFKRVDEKALMTRLSFIAQLEDIKAEDKAIEAISRHSEGSLRDGIQLLEQLTLDGVLTFEYVSTILGITDFETLDKLYEFIMANDTTSALRAVQDIYAQGYDLNQFCHEFINLVRKKLLESVENSNESLMGRYIKIIEAFQRAKENLKIYTIPQLPVEIAVIESTKTLKKQVFVEEVEEKVVVKKKKEDPIREKQPEHIEHVEHVEPITPIEPKNGPITLESVIENWPRITERITIPACKRSLTDGKVVAVDGMDVTIEFGSNFHRNKVIEHDNRVDVEHAFKEVFGLEIRVLSRLKEIAVGSPVTYERSHASIEESKDDDITNQALDVFGGELIDEDN